MRSNDHGICGEADWGPGQWGHKCIKEIYHQKIEGHECACGHKWTEVINAH